MPYSSRATKSVPRTPDFRLRLVPLPTGHIGAGPRVSKLSRGSAKARSPASCHPAPGSDGAHPPSCPHVSLLPEPDPDMPFSLRTEKQEALHQEARERGLALYNNTPERRLPENESGGAGTGVGGGGEPGRAGRAPAATYSKAKKSPLVTRMRTSVR